MEIYQHRRKAITYGKSRKKLHLDSIFDDEIISGAEIRADNLPTREQFKGSTTRKRTPNGITIQGQQTTAESHDRHSRLESPLTTDHSQDSSDSTSSHSSHQNGSASSSILDMLDSDEEACAQQLQPVQVKRRKITSLNNHPRSVKNGRVQKRDQAPVTALRESQKHRNAAPSQKKRLVPRQAKELIKDSISLHRDAPGPAKQISTQPVTELRKANRNKQMKYSNTFSLAPPASLPAVEKMQHRNEIDQDQGRMGVQRSPPETPKARRALQRTNRLSRPVASPSQIGLTSLRLTSDKMHPSRTASPENDAATLRRARHRLTDRLDAPGGERRLQSPSPGLDSNILMEAGENSNAKRTPVPQPRLAVTADFADVPASPKTTGAVNDRSVLTYAKERSHLSDMVYDVGDQKALPPSRLTPSIPAVPPGEFNQAVVDTQELDDRDELSTATAVKSIHELRQAGLNNRFERDMETHFEDIERHSSSSKALRIQALLQLIQKLNQSSLARQFVEVGMTRRLANCAQANVDTVSAVLLVHALSCLLLLDHMSARHVLATFHAIVSLSPSLLSHNEPFNKLVADRKQNFSKALSRELVDFGKSTQIGPFSGTTPWTPQHIALFALEHSLRMVRVLKAVPAEFPAALFNQVLVLLNTTGDNHVSPETQPQLVTAALSILEFSAVHRLSLEHEDDGKLHYSILANVVTRLMINKTTEDADLRSIALRLVVSLTNHEPGVCTALAATGLIPAVFEVVQQEFPRLSDSADRGDEFDNSKLDSVIMALGCLLNLADCSSEARKRMYAPSSSNSNKVQWLVSVFNERAGKAEEATTIAQSQVLVAFGYMSMLLCTLCLDVEVYDYVSASIQGKNVTGLCIEAEEFLDKLETVASLNPDDPATTTFNEHFRSILVNLSTRILS